MQVVVHLDDAGHVEQMTRASHGDVSILSSTNHKKWAALLSVCLMDSHSGEPLQTHIGTKVRKLQRKHFLPLKNG